MGDQGIAARRRDRLMNGVDKALSTIENPFASRESRLAALRSIREAGVRMLQAQYDKMQRDTKAG